MNVCTKLLAAAIAPAMIASAASAAVISVDLQKDNNDVVAAGAQGGTGVFDGSAGSTWNGWNLGDKNTTGITGPFSSGTLVTRDASGTLNNVVLTLQAGPQTVNADPKYRVRETNSPGSNPTDEVALHGDGLQIQHNDTSATFTFSGLIAGNPYDIRVHTMDRGGGVHVFDASNVLSANIATSSDGVFAGFVADGSGEVNIVVTDNSAYRDETIGGIEISGDFVNVVPEPGSLALVGLGGLLIARRRRG